MTALRAKLGFIVAGEVGGLSAYRDWCRLYGVNHAHCPRGCEHPQPFILNEGDGPSPLLCGRCWFVDGVRSEMVPCYPSVCE
jgi:hypothetical protein